jgi:hypothetical protein
LWETVCGVAQLEAAFGQKILIGRKEEHLQEQVLIGHCYGQLEHT